MEQSLQNESVIALTPVLIQWSVTLAYIFKQARKIESALKYIKKYNFNFYKHFQIELSKDAPGAQDA